MASSLRTLTACSALALALTACGGDDTSGTVPEVANTSQAAAVESAKAAGAAVIDVRTPEEYAEARVEGATNIDVQASARATGPPTRPSGCARRVSRSSTAGPWRTWPPPATPWTDPTAPTRTDRTGVLARRLDVITPQIGR